MDHVPSRECVAGCWFEGDNMGTAPAQCAYGDYGTGRSVDYSAEHIVQGTADDQGAWEENPGGGSFGKEGLKYTC